MIQNISVHNRTIMPEWLCGGGTVARWSDFGSGGQRWKRCGSDGKAPPQRITENAAGKRFFTFTQVFTVLQRMQIMLHFVQRSS